jgi:hypothetical protein
MTYAIQDPVNRSVAPCGTTEIIEVVADAMGDGPPARWPHRHRAHHRNLYQRHGYQVRSVIDQPDGPSLWTMWRSLMTC